ncbi:MAG: hydroxymethylbilane synthase [Propionibacteriaceae bacterium]|jgi:hydroxymethylbilane synthase|nr:hydroxymethylbilane synthase [Propionibacteriaceae bacterium]
MTAPDKLRLGTRASALALAQSGLIARQVEALTGQPVELVTIHSHGDQDQVTPLHQMGGTGVFTTAVRQALLDRQCDLVVHSLKDLPTEPVAGLALATPVRAEPWDALCGPPGTRLDRLPPGAKVGTGSPRRSAQLRLLRPDLELVPLRGNVDTRLGRVFNTPASLDAVVLAQAGLQRLDRADRISQVFQADELLPAAGQGALAIEARADEVEGSGPLAAVWAGLHDPATGWAIAAERAVLRHLAAGCSAPVGVLAQLDGQRLVVEACVAWPDGLRVVRQQRSAELVVDEAGQVVDQSGPLALAEALGRSLADDLISVGGPALQQLMTD